MAYFSIKTEMNQLMEMFEGYENVEDTVNSVLWTSGAEEIKNRITNILPVSGRTWQGKAKAAKVAKPFTQKNSNLQVEILTRAKYNYLYFPDDGSNTKHHRGNQQFMFKGAQNAQEQIVDTILNKLTRS